MDSPISFGSSPFYFHSEQINTASLSPTPPVQLRQIKKWKSHHQTICHLKQYGIKKKFPFERLKPGMWGLLGFGFLFCPFFQSRKTMEAVQWDKQHYTLQLHTSTCISKAALLTRWPKEAFRGKVWLQAATFKALGRCAEAFTSS